MSLSIGVAIITCDRNHMLNTLLESLEMCDDITKLVVVNDHETPLTLDRQVEVIENGKNLGVGKAKNIGLAMLFDAGVEHLFLLEDDMIIKSPEVFSKYIHASKTTGIKHLNFCLHGEDNKRLGKPNPKLIVDYKDLNISLYHNVYGSLSYYHRDVIDSVGYMDEQYYNAMEHVDHTMEVIKAGWHPPFRWFADIENSHELVDEQDINHEQSKIRNDQEWLENFKRGVQLFYEKHEVNVCSASQPVAEKSEVIDSLKQIKNENC